MRPEGVFAYYYKLFNLFQTKPENNPPALSQLRWPPFALIADQLAACDCSICKMCIEPLNGLNLVTGNIQLYGGITGLQIPEFDHAQPLYEQLADCGHKAALPDCLKSIDRRHFESIMRPPYPIDYHDCLTAPTIASPYASAHPVWRASNLAPRIQARGGDRSFVAFSKRLASAANLVRLPVALHGEAQAGDGPAFSQGAARVIDFQAWVLTKQARGANKGKMTRQKIRRMTMREKRLRILDLISDDDMDHQTLASILEFLESITPDTESQT